MLHECFLAGITPFNTPIKNRLRWHLKLGCCHQHPPTKWRLEKNQAVERGCSVLFHNLRQGWRPFDTSHRFVFLPFLHIQYSAIGSLKGQISRTTKSAGQTGTTHMWRLHRQHIPGLQQEACAWLQARKVPHKPYPSSHGPDSNYFRSLGLHTNPTRSPSSWHSLPDACSSWAAGGWDVDQGNSEPLEQTPVDQKESVPNSYRKLTSMWPHESQTYMEWVKFRKR